MSVSTGDSDDFLLLDHLNSLHQVESCQRCFFKDEQIRLLQEEVHVLRDMLNTCQVYQQLNETLYSNLVEVGCQATMQTVDDVSPVIEVGAEIEVGLSVNSSVKSTEAEKVDRPENPLCKTFYSGALSDISSPSETASDLVFKPVNSTEISYIKPVEILDGCPFSQFSFDKMVKDLGSFTHQFSNRSAMYFGKYPYRYIGGAHEPRNVKQGSYLDKLCCFVEVVLPDFRFNSILVHMFENGKQWMPSHSDNEECIEENSEIVTVSLGTTRELVIKEFKSGKVVQSACLEHGSVTKMSKYSQTFYRHEITEDHLCLKPRISLTFRLIKNPDVHAHEENTNNAKTPESSSCSPCGFVPYSEYPPQSKPPVREPLNGSTQPKSVMAPARTSSVLYISSSMFRHIDTKKLSSKNVEAMKLFYPGANASIMLQKLKKDLPSLNAKPSAIYIMSGTNNVDSIYYGSRSLRGAIDDLTELLEYLRLNFPGVDINVLNILPRSTKGKNDVVMEINRLLKNFCKSSGIRFMETLHLFNTMAGKRRNQYFISSNDRISDNCHLNAEGVTRLGKFLKFWTHSHLN